MEKAKIAIVATIIIPARAAEASAVARATRAEAEKDERVTYLVDLPTTREAQRQENQARVFNVYSQQQLARYQDQDHLPPNPVEKGLDFDQALDS